MSPAGLEEIRRFIHDEARLLDERRLADWLALLTDDVVYWIPRQRAQTDALAIPSIVYEDRALLAMRIERLSDPAMHAAAPTPHTLHLVGSVDVVAEDRAKAECRVASAQLVVVSGGGEQRLYAGACEHLLRRDGRTIRIARKRIELVDCDAVQRPMSVLL